MWAKNRKKVNQSGSSKIKKFEHAQRLEGEPANAEYNPSTSSRYPSKYLAQKEKIINLYNTLKASNKVARALNISEKTVTRCIYEG